MAGATARPSAGHASWLNRIEINFSVLRRKAFTPDNFASFDEIAARILGFQERYHFVAQPFEWKFTRYDLDRLLNRCDARGLTTAA